MNKTKPVFPEIRCADCLGKLYGTVNDDVLTCQECGAQWPAIGGVPWMSRNTSSYHEDVPENIMQALVRESVRVPWREAFWAMLRQLDLAKAKHISKNVLDVNRGMAHFLAPLTEESCVLDFGCGWGNLSIDLAGSARSVVAMDLAPLRAQFTKLRVSDDHITNIMVVGGGDTQRLPWLNDSFDFVLMNGVLEFTALNKPGPPVAIQQDVLKETLRILKPGGSLCIGIENRLSFRYFLGAPEDHVQLPFIALMPRHVANWYCQRRRGHDYRTHTHSLGTYRRLLKAAGYDQISFFYPVPDYRFPEHIVPLSSASAVQYLANIRSWHGMGRLGQVILLRMGLFKYFTHSFIILAKKKID